MNLAMQIMLLKPTHISDSEPMPENKELKKTIKILGWCITGMLLLFIVTQLASVI